MARRCTAALLGLIAAACSGSKGPPAGLGKAVFEGPARELSASADGALLAFLDGCQEVNARFLPPRTAICDLRVVPSAGGEARRVAGAVPTLPHAVAWSPVAPVLAALAEYEFPTATAALVRWEAGGARTLAQGVTFHGLGAHGEIGWVAGGRVSVLLPGVAEPRVPRGADGVASFDLSPQDPARCGEGHPTVRLLARRSHAAGGQLLAASCDLAEARPLEGGQVGEYGFAPAAAHLAWTVQGKEGAELRLASATGAAAVTLGRGAQSFAFAPTGQGVAFIADVVPGKQGNLHLAEPGGRPGVLLAREVGELRWARAAPRLAWLEKYDPRVRSGTLGAGGPGLRPRTFGADVSDFEISSDGRHVAFLRHTTRSGYSVDLALGRLDDPPEAKPEEVARGVFGFAFSPDGKWLYYRTRCVRNGEACDLERIPASGRAGAPPTAVAQGVKSFEFDPRDPSRLLVTWQRKDMVALDVAVWEGGKLTSVDTAVAPGSARFLGPDSRRVAYVVVHPKRQGVYVAELPR